MKTLLVLILSSILINDSYEIEYRNWHLPFDNQKMEDLYKNGEIVEKVWIGNVHAYSKRKIGTNIYEEYYRINDSLYQYIKTIDTLILDKGLFKLKTNNPEYIDTIYFGECNNSKPNNIFQIHKYYKPVRTHHWKQNSTANKSSKGNYIDGKKDGIWISEEEKVNFEMGDTIGIDKPSTAQIKDKLHWLINNNYSICSKYIFQGDTLNTNALQSGPLKSVKYNETCDDNIQFNFSDKLLVEIEHNIIESSNKENISGKYNYEINRNSNLVIDLKQYGKIVRKLKYFGKDQLR